MEIQDLKSIWTKVVDAESTKYQLDQNKMHQLIHKKSNTTLSKVKQDLAKKRWFFAIFGGFAIIASPINLLLNKDSSYFLDSVLSTLEMSGIMFLLGLTLIILLVNTIHRYKKLINYEKASEQLKPSLKNALSIIENIKRTHTYFNVIIISFLASVGLYRFLFESDHFVVDIRVIYIIVGTAIVAFFMKRLSDYSEGRQFDPFIKDLKDCISDIETLDDYSE